MMNMLNDLVARLLPERYREALEFELLPGRKHFSVATAGQHIRIRGNDELALAAGLMHYLKRECRVHYSWCGDQTGYPAEVPLPRETTDREFPFAHRPYLNYCTFGYSAAWWDLERWQREIDFMALNGINMPLAATGVEAVWRATFRRLGISEPGLAEFFSGPAFLPWQWMDNLDGHAGPLPAAWIDSHAGLGREIVRRERAWGMSPILPGFSGHVPAEFARIHPEAQYLPESEWCTFRPVRLLNPADPWFRQITKIYMEELTALFGATHYYAIDLFHERSAPSSEPEFLASLGREIAATLIECDPAAVWVMQAWTENEHIIRGIPPDRLLILDIGKQRLENTGGLYGVPTVRGIIHSFGGQTEIGGSLDTVAGEFNALRHYPNLVGAGAFPESIGNNPALFELLFEAALTPRTIDVEPWLDAYVVRRYGVDSPVALAAWRLLKSEVYSCRRGDPFLAARPCLHPDRANAWAGFKPTDVPRRFFPAWRKLLSAAAACGAADGYRFDLIDLGRQALSSLGEPLFERCRAAFLRRDARELAAATRVFLEYLDDCDTLLGSRPEFRLDDAIRQARSWGTTPDEADLYEYNVRLQITLWGPVDHPAPLFDYCCREWQGLISTYYRPRWEQFLRHLAELLEHGQTLEEATLKRSDNRPALWANAFYASLYEFERNWVASTASTAPKQYEDEIVIARRLCQKYGSFADEGETATPKPETEPAGDLLTGFLAVNH